MVLKDPFTGAEMPAQIRISNAGACGSAETDESWGGAQHRDKQGSRDLICGR